MNQIPTLQQIYSQVLAEMESQMNITIPLFGKSFLRALAMVQAAKLWHLYLRLSIVQKNVWIDTADSVANGGTLERIGFVKLGRYPNPAIQGKYICTVNAEDGAIIQGGTQFLSNDSALNPSKLFILDQTYTCNGYLDEIELRALEAGDGSALSIGDTLTSIIPIALVDSIVTVALESVQPEASEDLEDYRRKAIDSFRLLPQGGSPADYRLWSSEVSGVVQTYPYTASGVTNQVNLFIEADTVDGVPTPTDLLNVEENIELPTATRPARKPVTDIVNYLPVTPRVIDINISSFIPTPSVALQSLIYSAIQSKLSEIRPFVDSIDIVANRNDYFDINSIIATILEAQPGSVFGAVTMDVDTIPTSSITFTNGDIPQLGVITYV
jgi:uncharacterized phage protein gp47/JayE